MYASADRVGNGPASNVMSADWMLAMGWKAGAIALVSLQCVFLLYLVTFYGSSLALGDPSLWSKNTLLPQGYVAGDPTGNALFGLHALSAIIIIGAGLIQLQPWIRKAWPVLHRISGRIYLALALFAAIFGMALKLVRNDAGWLNEIISPIGGNALVLIICAGMAWRYARRREYGKHQSWALRAFMAISAVWFLRVGFFATFVIMKSFGFSSKDIMGIFPAWGVLSYILPIGILELYWRARQSGSALKIFSALTLFTSALLMILGTCVLLKISWMPLIAEGLRAWTK